MEIEASTGRIASVFHNAALGAAMHVNLVDCVSRKPLGIRYRIFDSENSWLEFS